MKASFNYIDGIELTFEQVQLMSHSGDCYEEVKQCMLIPEIAIQLAKIDPKQLVKELEQYGAWDEDELERHDKNLERILWIAAGNISDYLVCTDPEKGRYRFMLQENEVYLFGQRGVVDIEMNIQDYTEAEIREACDMYDYDHSLVDVPLILEILFELSL